MPGPLPVQWVSWDDSWGSVTTTASTLITYSPSQPYTVGSTGSQVTLSWPDAGANMSYWQPPSNYERAIRWVAEEESRVQRDRLTRETSRASVIERATRTLLELLDPAQRAQYETDRTFELTGSAGGRYRIRPGTAGNVDWLDPGDPAAVAGVLCAHPVLWDGEGHLPGPDVALAQFLALITDEAHFVRTANVHRGQRPVIPSVRV